MATDRDDDVSRRYRALSREEPPAAIDAAVLAASRRAVGARPGSVKRWGPPLSIAAVLVLAIGVVLRMQSERPGVENAVPEAAVSKPAPAEMQALQAAYTAEAAPSPPQAPAAKSFAPAPKAAKELKRAPATAAPE